MNYVYASKFTNIVTPRYVLSNKFIMQVNVMCSQIHSSKKWHKNDNYDNDYGNL